MFVKPHCPVIAIEEHFWDEELAKTYTGSESGRPGDTQKRLYDFDTIRIAEMDAAGASTSGAVRSARRRRRSCRPATPPSR